MTHTQRKSIMKTYSWKKKAATNSKKCNTNLTKP